MKILVDLVDKNIDSIKKYCDGVILGLNKFSVFSDTSYSLTEIKDITSKYKNLEIFIKIDKNIFNDELEKLKEALTYLDKLNITGVFFYDLALLKLKKDLNLKLDLIWSQTHMVTNYRTCNYYHEQGVKYALLSKEITLDEILEISKLSKITPMVEVVSLPSVGYSRRKLITNYSKDFNVLNKKQLEVLEKVSQDKYLVKEEEHGTGFLLKNILNGTSIISKLYEKSIPYIIFREYGIDDFKELIKDTRTYLLGECKDNNYIEKYQKLGNNTGFFYKKTIYRVKK